jgi:GTP-binding protein
LIGEDRAVVSSIAGTTIDPVDEVLPYKDKLITFVDTAGIRKRGKIEGIERYALNRTQKMLENADIALIVLDASEEFKELDERIASLVDKFSLGSIIILNKWDKARDEYKKVVEDVRYRFKFLGYSPIITVSALSKKRVHKINDMILQVYENYSRRIPTGKLNELIKFANSRHHLPSDMGKVVKIYFATQFDIRPPKIALVMNRPKSLHFSYKRYLINTIREHFDFEGSPILIFPRKRGEKDEEQCEEQ